jgi:hypothetical protein
MNIADVTRTRVVSELGVATDGTNATLVDTLKSWIANKWAGAQVEIVKPDGRQYFSTILTNTATQLNITALPAGIVVAAGDFYNVLASNDPAGAKLIRWGRDVTPTWTHAAEAGAPGALTALVTQAVGAGHVGYIYGFFASATEANNFLINWVSATVAYAVRLPFGGQGFVQDVEPVPLNEGLAADAGSNITIQNVNAGALGSIYQARILYAEV